MKNSNNIDDYYFTKREIEILLFLSEGLTNSEIADKLCISPHTVEVHKSNLVNKLNFRHSSELYCWTASNKEKIKMVLKIEETSIYF